MVYFGIQNEAVPWGGWHVTVCGRVDLSVERMRAAVTKAIVSYPVNHALGCTAAVSDWCREDR